MSPFCPLPHSCRWKWRNYQKVSKRFYWGNKEKRASSNIIKQNFIPQCFVNLNEKRIHTLHNPTSIHSLSTVCLRVFVQKILFSCVWIIIPIHLIFTLRVLLEQANIWVNYTAILKMLWAIVYLLLFNSCTEAFMDCPRQKFQNTTFHRLACKLMHKWLLVTMYENTTSELCLEWSTVCTPNVQVHYYIILSFLLITISIISKSVSKSVP